MNPVLILAAELHQPAYAALDDAAAAAALDVPIDNTRGRLDLDWLDGLLVQAGCWPTLEAAAGGSVPAAVWDGQGAQPPGSITAEQATAAVLAARQVRDLVHSPRHHAWLDASKPEVDIALAALVAAGVVSAPLVAAVNAAARVTRAQQLGLPPVTQADVARARRYLRKGVP